MQNKKTTDTRAALMKLIEIESDHSPCSQDEFNRRNVERKHSLTTLMRSDDPLLNLVAVAATARRWGWLRDADLLLKIHNWLGQQSQLADLQAATKGGQ